MNKLRNPVIQLPRFIKRRD